MLCSKSQTLRFGEQPLLGFGRVESLQGGSAERQVQILHHHSSLQSPQQQTLTTYDDIVLATEKLPPSHAPVLHSRPNAREWPVFVPD